MMLKEQSRTREAGTERTCMIEKCEQCTTLAEETDVDSCGIKGKGETPQCKKHEEAHQPPAESEVYFRSECYASTIMMFGFLINKNFFVPASFCYLFC